MELPDRSTSSEEDQSPVRQSSGGKLQRIAGHTQGLVEDLREWIDLRIDLAVLEVEEKVDRAQNQIALGIVLATLGFFAGLFGLTTLALGIGWALGRPFWGFLAVFVLLVVLLVSVQAAKPELVPRPDLREALRGGDDADDRRDRPAREASAGESTGSTGPPSSSEASAGTDRS
jgi:uncharacterized membrane protein YqjE